MEKVSLPLLYRLGSQLNPLTKMKPEPNSRIDFWLSCVDACNTVDALLRLPVGLRVCRSAASALNDSIDEAKKWILAHKAEDFGKPDYSADATFEQIVERAKSLETILSEELSTLSAYYASQKGIYSTSDLVDQAEKVLPPTVLAKVNQFVVEEVRHGGRCLAFDNSTASGFHMLRATEAVLHEYYLSVCKPRSRSKLGNWGAYLAALRKITDNPTKAEAINDYAKKVLALLQQIKDQDRNLIMHPEVVLQPDEAFTLFEIAKGAIMAMSERLPQPKKEKVSGAAGAPETKV